jgi:TPR repeat protein
MRKSIFITSLFLLGATTAFSRITNFPLDFAMKSFNELKVLKHDLEEDCAKKKPDACLDLGYLNMNGLAQDSESLMPAGTNVGAMTAFGKACDGGNTRACFWAISIDPMIAVNGKLKEYVAKFKEMCKAGIAPACAQYGQSHNQIGDSEATAAPFLEKSCEGGDGKSCTVLGDWAKSDAQKAAKFYEKACRTCELKDRENFYRDIKEIDDLACSRLKKSNHFCKTIMIGYCKMGAKSICEMFQEQQGD